MVEGKITIRVGRLLHLAMGASFGPDMLRCCGILGYFGEAIDDVGQ